MSFINKGGCLALCIVILAVSCKTQKDILNSSSIPSQQYLFPIDWIGHYEGDLHILGANSDTLTVPMSLTIDNPDASGMYPWVLKYGEQDQRYYGLEVIDATRGHYRIDEYNGIKLDAYLRSNHLITDFEVMNSQLIFHYEKRHDGVAIQVHSSSSSGYNTTGDEIIGQDTIPPVKSFIVNGYQIGFLKKVK